MKTTDSSKRLIAVYQVTRCHIPEDRNLNTLMCAQFRRWFYSTWCDSSMDLKKICIWNNSFCMRASPQMKSIPSWFSKQNYMVFLICP